MSLIVLSTGNLVYRYSLRRISEIAKRSGIEGLEVVINKRVVDEFENRGFRIFTETEIPVVSLHAPYHIIGSWGLLRSELKRTIKIAARSGIQRIVFHPPVNPLLQPDFYMFLQRSRTLEDLKNSGVEILVENLPKSITTALWHQPEKFLNWVKLKKFYVALDCTHISSWGITPLEGFKMFKDYLKSIHLNNTYECHIDAHLPPNEGCLNIEELLTAVRDGPMFSDYHFVLEINFHLKKEEEIEEVIQRSADFVKLCLGKA